MKIEEFNNLQKKLLGKSVSVYLIGRSMLTGLWITNQVNSVTASIRMVLKTEKGEIAILLNQIKSIVELT